MLDHPLFNFWLSTLPRAGFFAVLVIAVIFLNPAASAQTPPSISGTITLQGYAATNRNQPLTFTFQPGAGSTVTTIQLGGGDVAYWFPSGTGGTGLTRTITPNTDGTYTITDIPAGKYNLYVKGSKWLQKGIAIDTSNGNVTGVNLTLLTGDVDNDNYVSSTDYLILRNAYGATPSSANWDARADLNGDDYVSSTDYLMLRTNYGISGDVPLIAISNLTAASGNGQISLTWSAVSGAAGYTVYQSDTSDGPYLKMNAVPVTGTSYVDGDLANGKHFYYYVTALNTAGESYQSNQADAVPQVPASAKTRTQEEVIQTARTFCQAIGVSLNDMTVTANFPAWNMLLVTGPQEARWTVCFEKVLAQDSTGRDKMQDETIEIVDATGLVCGYDSRISGGVDDDRQPQGPAISEAQAIQYALTALQATGEPDELAAVPEAKEIRFSNDYTGHYWQVSWDRQYQGIPLDTSGAFVMLQAETGKVHSLSSLNGDYISPPAPSVVANLMPQAQAENIAQGQINTAGIQNTTLGSSRLELISSTNPYWQNGSTERIACPVRAAWLVTFWIGASTDGFNRDVWVDAQTGDIIGGDGGSGWNGNRPHSITRPKAVVRQNKKAVISKKAAARKATASPKAPKQKKAASHAPPPRHSHKSPRKHSA